MAKRVWRVKGDGRGWHRVEITRVVITRCHGDKVLADEVPQPRTRGLSSHSPALRASVKC